MNKQRLKYVCLLLLSVFLYSCSSTRFTYNNLDWVIDWYFGDYLDLNSSQNTFYEQRLAALLKWHRREQLIRYSAFLQQVQNDLQSEVLNAPRLQELSGRVNRFWRDIMERAAPDCAQLLLQLDINQRKIFYQALAKKQQEYEDTYLIETMAERVRRERAQALKIIKRFSGDLNSGQKQQVERWSENLQPIRKAWLENRRTWQQNLQAALEAGAPEPEKRKRLELLFVEPEQLWGPAYRDALRRNEKATIDLVASLVETLSVKQQQHFHAALEKLKRDFMILSRE